MQIKHDQLPLYKKGLVKLLLSLLLLFLSFLMCGSSFAQSLNDILSKPDNWFNSTEAIQIADNVLLFQRNAGAWGKGENYFEEYSEAEKQKIHRQKQRRDCTFDNGATYTELYFLEKVYNSTKYDCYRLAFNRGIDLIFDAQYANGGWPQYYPESHKIWSRANSKWSPGGIEHFITYNDGAMIGIMRLLKAIADHEDDFRFVDAMRKEKAEAAVERGINCILKTQFRADGKKTAWPAQADEKTLAPRWGRSFEPPSLAARESVGIIRFLMSIDHPDEKIISSVQSAVNWLHDVRLLNTKILYGDIMTVVEENTGISHSGRRDVFIQKDADAAPVWARFYELNTFRPVFCSRDDTVRYELADISVERRSGYAWYGYWPESLLSTEYPEWSKKHHVKNVLQP